MKSRGKRFFKRLFGAGGVLILIGIGLFIGLVIGTNSANRQQRVVFRPDRPFQGEVAHTIEQQIEERIERHIEDRIVEEIVIPPIPPIPAIPEIPDLSGINTDIHIERTPSFWDVLNGIGTILGSMILMGMGGMILIRRWRQPKEKSPDSAGA
jgi:hypothetical protein